MRYHASTLTLFFSVLILLISCKKDDPEPEPVPVIDPSVQNTLVSGGGTLSFIRSFNGPLPDGFYSGKPCSDGGYILCGFTENQSTSERDVLLVKTDSSGATVWMQRFDGGFTDVGWSVLETADGGFILAGTSALSASSGTAPLQGMVIRTNANGQQVWKQNFDLGTYTQLEEICPTADGGYAICGYESASGNAFVLKINDLGVETWRKTFGGNTRFASVSTTMDGGYIVAGSVFNTALNDLDAVVYRLNASGDSLWTRTISRSGDNEFRSICETSLGYFMMGGYASDPVKTGTAVMLTEIGTDIWQRDLTGYAIHETNYVTPSPGSNFIFSGSGTGSAGTSAGFLFEMDELGKTLWFKNYEPGSITRFNEVRPTADDGFMVSGYTTLSGNSAALLLKTDGSGN